MAGSTPPRRIVVTGASQGLGLGFARHWLEAGNQIFALSRRAEEESTLSELAARHPGALHRRKCDVSDPQSVHAAAAAVAASWDSVDVLVNNAGIYGPKDSGLEDLDLADVRRVFEINTLGPVLVTRALLPLLRKGRDPRVVHVTSLMGSLADNASGGAYPYRMSKAALNMAARNMAHELASGGVICTVIHPGWVRTGMGGAGAPLTVDESVPAMTKTIEGLTTRHSGGFFDRHGDRLPW